MDGTGRLIHLAATLFVTGGLRGSWLASRGLSIFYDEILKLNRKLLRSSQYERREGEISKPCRASDHKTLKRKVFADLYGPVPPIQEPESKIVNG